VRALPIRKLNGLRRQNSLQGGALQHRRLVEHVAAQLMQCRQFIEEASKLFTDALTHELDDPSKFVTDCAWSGLPGAQHLHVGCARSRARKRPKSVRKTLKSLQKPSATSVEGKAEEDRSS
jgi:hypothetical protein